MAEGFLTTPRAPRAIRLAAVAIGLAAIALATRTTIASFDWVNRVFPGFVLLDNRVIASVGFAHWNGSEVAGLYQSEVVAVDGSPAGSTAEVYARVGATTPGTPVRYRLRRGGVERDVTVATQRFGLRDWTLLFGAFLLNAAVYLASGLLVWVLRPGLPVGRALLALGVTFAVFFSTAIDLYGPGRFFRLHTVAEPFMGAAAFHTTLYFPTTHRRARALPAFYLLSLVLVGLYQWFLYDPPNYSRVLLADTAYMGFGGLLFFVRLVWEYVAGSSAIARQRARAMLLGTLIGFGIPGLILVLSLVFQGDVSMNVSGVTPFIFMLSLTYAVVKHDLFDIETMVKRGAYYLVLTGLVGAAYVGAVIVFNLILKAGEVTDSPAFPIFFTLAVLLLFNPLRSRLQAFVDRVFFRTRYDAAQVLAEIGAALGSARLRSQIAELVRAGVETAIPNGCTRLLAGDAASGLHEIGGEAVVPDALVRELAADRIVTAFDSVELYPDAPTHEAVRRGLVALDAEVAVPLRLQGALVGVLTAGPKRSGLFYTAGDAGFLRALAHQAAIALENAASYEALVALNASLEERVRVRTAQLVQSEKMASLGRLVAGVAHEINNPVSFIASSIAPLRRRLQQAAQHAAPDAATPIKDAEELVGIMARGAERTASIVKDLRTFSRLGEATRKTVDVTEGLDVSLRLLEPRWRDRIEVHRAYGAVPPVECDPGQVNQVLMNVLANACDAIRDRGNIWVATRQEGETAIVEIRDDGAGMPPEVQARIFDPFFTTKDVGAGTGLGLAISHGIVAAHDGRIEVESAPGRGSTFRIVLPIRAAGATLDRAATPSR